jgi:hypothetical protein
MAPPLTADEKQFLLQDSAASGCYKLIRSRCIDGIEIDKRPIHLVDVARKKYLVHTKGEWTRENGGHTIVKGVMDKVREFWIADVNNDSKEVMELKAMRMMEYIQESNKIMNYVNDYITLKNNVGSLLKELNNKKLIE